MNKAWVAFSLSGLAFLLLIVYVIALGNIKLTPNRNTGKMRDSSAKNFACVVVAQKSKGSLLIFEKLDEQWKLTYPENIPYDQSVAEALPLTLVSLTAKKEISANTDSLAEYGLDDPVVVHAYTRLPDNFELINTHLLPAKTSALPILSLGAENSDKTSRYFSFNGKIYTMDSAAADALMLNTLNIRDKNILAFNRTLKLNDIAAKITNIRVNGELNTELTDALAKLNADTFIGNIDFTPDFTIEFEYDGQPRILYIGVATPSDNYFYAMTSDSDMVFTVQRRGFESLSK